MKTGRAVGIAAAVGAGALVACWPFEQAFEDCRDGGHCVGQLLDAGGCPTGQVAAGYCLMEAHRNTLDGYYYSVWGLAPNNVYFGGWDEILTRYDGTSFTDGHAFVYPGFAYYIYGFAGTAADDVWAIGYGYLAHYDSLAWSDVSPTLSISALAGYSIARGQVVTAGSGGIFLWTADRPDAPDAEYADPDVYVRDVTGFGPGRVYAVGSNTVDGGAYLLHRESDGGWSQQLIPIAEPWAMAGSSEEDLWVVGESGRAIHRTGGAWQQVATGTVETLSNAWVSSDGGEVWFTGQSNRVFHRMPDGGIRALELPGVGTNTLYDVWGFDNGDVWVTGYETTFDGTRYYDDAGYALRYRPMNP